MDLEKWKQIIKSGKGTRLLVLLFVLLAVLLLLPKSSGGAKEAEITPAEISSEEYAQALSKQISEMVSAITGEPDPHVTVTLKSAGETVYATEDKQSERNEQQYNGETLNKTQTDGDTERTYILVKSSDGSQRPIVISRTEPEVKGIVVVSRFGENPTIREKITLAVKTALNLSSTQVCVTGYCEYT